MTPTQQYFAGTIGDAASKAFELMPESVVLKDGKVVITIDPTASESLFWQAVAEQAKCE